MLPLPFIPRKVAQRSVKPPHPKPAYKPSQNAESSASSSTRQLVEPGDETKTEARTLSKGKGRSIDRDSLQTGTTNDEDYATLVSLSLSEYALWSDPDLRRMIEMNDERYIPLTYLCRHSSMLAALSPQPFEAALVKALRSHKADTVEVRVLMSNPSKSAWYGNGSEPKDALGGYEIRRRDWAEALSRVRNTGRQDWELKTIYMERIPLQYRTIPGIHHLVSIISQREGLDTTPHLIQHISFPRHHQDKPTDVAKCKGFALVTLQNNDRAEHLLEQWPWDRRMVSGDTEDRGNTTEVNEAIKFGFRTLPKVKWEKLNEEYLAHRQKLLDDITKVEQVQTGSSEDMAVHEGRSKPEPESLPRKLPIPPSASARPSTTLTSPYPLRCLVYVRNIHPETNKTTLKTLFSHAFLLSNNADRKGSTDGLDYVDFNKGMDTCYLRLSTPAHTELLINYFTSNPVIQTQGLDSKGSSPSSVEGLPGKPIVMELVEGKREELYWEKVPEKVRKQAVEKAVKGCEEIEEIERDDVKAEEGKRNRKRRKKVN